MRAIVSVGVLLACVMPCQAQDKNKGYVELDRDAIKLFEAGKYADATKVWNYIVNKYPRSEFRAMPYNDPRKMSWQVVFFGAIIREGLARDQFGKIKDNASSALSRAKSQMNDSRLSPAFQTHIINIAQRPLQDALKKAENK